MQDNVIEVNGESKSAIIIEEDEYIKSSNKFGCNDNNLRDRFDAVVDALEIIPTLEQIFSTQNLNKNNVLIKARSNMTNIKNEIYYKIHENVLRPTQVSLKKNNIFII